ATPACSLHSIPAPTPRSSPEWTTAPARRSSKSTRCPDAVAHRHATVLHGARTAISSTGRSFRCGRGDFQAIAHLQLRVISGNVLRPPEQCLVIHLARQLNAVTCTRHLDTRLFPK